MFKKTHIKTIMSFFIIGIIIITGLGIINILNLNDIKMQISNINAEKEIEQMIDYLIKFTIILDITYSILCIIMAVVFSKILNKPIINPNSGAYFTFNINIAKVVNIPTITASNN